MASGGNFGVAGSILSGITGGKGAKKAAQIQADAYQKGIDEQHRQFDVTNSEFAPYREAGSKGLASILDLLGLGAGGAQAQGSAIDALKASPGFTSLYNTGMDTISQNAAATGGLRGGNTQNSFANYGSGLLSNLIQNQLGSLGGLVSTGVGAVNSTAGFGQQTANNVTDLLGKQGGANAVAAAAPYAAWQGILNQAQGSNSSLVSRALAGGLGW